MPRVMARRMPDVVDQGPGTRDGPRTRDQGRTKNEAPSTWDDRIGSMSDSLATPATTPARLWKKMSVAHRQKAALAFWQADEAVDDQVQAALLIAQAKKFRPKS